MDTGCRLRVAYMCRRPLDFVCEWRLETHNPERNPRLVLLCVAPARSRLTLPALGAPDRDHACHVLAPEANREGDCKPRKSEGSCRTASAGAALRRVLIWFATSWYKASERPSGGNECPPACS